MSEGTDHLSSCQITDCDECCFYLESCMACDQCGEWDDMDSDGWVIGQFGVYCSKSCKIRAKDS